MNRALEEFVKQQVTALGFDLIEFRKGGSARTPLLDVRIDRRDGTKVTVGDCATVSKLLQPQLDEAALVSQNYVLEVSSPGAERLLRHAADWRRFAGRRAQVQSEVLGGRVAVDIVGVEGDEENEIGVVRDLRGQEHRVPLHSVREARLVLVWK